MVGGRTNTQMDRQKVDEQTERKKMDNKTDKKVDEQTELARILKMFVWPIKFSWNIKYINTV